VIVSGEGLPAASSSDVVSATTDGRFRRYVESREAERFAAELRGQGAAILEISSLGLRELFLHLVRKEDPCTPGNAGAKAAPVCKETSRLSSVLRLRHPCNQVQSEFQIDHQGA
jgi:hypothetical protein